jgi:hypothetical protein
MFVSEIILLGLSVEGHFSVNINAPSVCVCVCVFFLYLFFILTDLHNANTGTIVEHRI